ncbi:Zinc knuckle [Aphelenchoides besseyi]|nr:Zinc knuckle [Aphelenchoides besseyi]
MSSRSELRKWVEERSSEAVAEAIKIIDNVKNLTDVNIRKENTTIDERVTYTFQLHSLYDGGSLVHVKVCSNQKLEPNESTLKAKNFTVEPKKYSALVFVAKLTHESAIAALREAVEILPQQVYSNEKPQVSRLCSEYLEQNYIVPNTTNNRRFDQYALFCTVCEVHIKSLFDLLTHKRQPEHDLHVQRLRQRAQMADKCENKRLKITTPYRDCMDKIHKRVLQNVRHFYHMKEVNELKSTMEVFGKLQKDCQVTFHSIGGFSNLLVTRDKGSRSVQTVVDYFVEIKATDGSQLSSTTRIKVFQKLLSSYQLVEREDHLNGLVFAVNVDNETVHLFMTIDPKAEKLILTTRLFSLYVRFSPEYLQLAQVLRYWGHCMGFEKTFDEDGVSGAIFDYMALYFMQQNDFLPILNEESVNCSLEEFLNKPPNEVIQTAKSIFDEHKNLHKIPHIAKLWMDLILYYGCQFNRQEIIQIVSKTKQEKENKGRRHIRILDPIQSMNIFQMRMENFSHLENCFFLGAADFLALKSRDGLYEELRITSYGFQQYRHQRNVGFVFLLYDSRGRKKSMNRDRTVKIQFSNGVNSWNPCLLKRAPLLCTWCRNDPHLCRNCPLLARQTDLKYKKVADELSVRLSSLCTQWFEDQHLTDKEIKLAHKFINSFARKFNRKTKQKIEFWPFGSLMSGFGAKGCDLDLCVHFSDEDATEEAQRNILNKLFEYCNENDAFTTVRHVPRAKVPIINFAYNLGDIKYHGDISCSNKLAIYNTELLKTYTLLDSRLAPFVLAIKNWFKVMDLNDASTGTLSSYAITIMSIHFLQQIQPPVLIGLQDEDRVSLPNSEMVEGWDVRFARDLDLIAFKSENTASLGQLFVEFFDYFDEFDWKNQVVQIRHCSQTLYKIDKDWTRSSLAVEDPFELDHNLSAGVRTHKFMYILKCLNEMRSEFRNPNCKVLDSTFEFPHFKEMAPKKPEAPERRERRPLTGTTNAANNEATVSKKS